MTLNVPLAVSVGGKHLTRKIEGLSFRKEAVGGVSNITAALSAPLSSLAISAYDKVLVSDARTAKVIAEGRVSDLGRTANLTEGQKYSMAALGPAAHASDYNAPLMVIDQSMDDGWRRVKRAQSAGGDVGQSTKPTTDTTDAIVAQFSQGKTVDTGDQLAMRYERIRDADQRLGSVAYDWDAGRTDADFKARILGVLDNTPDGSAAASSNWNTAGGSHRIVYTTDFTIGRNQFDLEAYYSGAGTSPTTDRYWASFANIVIRSLLYDQAGGNQGNASDYVEADWVVEHLLGGGWLPQYDGAGASIDRTAAQQIDQMAYPDGISAREVLEDLMALEPAHFWTTGPADITGNGYPFWWKLWPTTVRYEATLEDGGDFPTTSTELYNEVLVRWVDRRGRSRSTIRTGTCPTLDAAGITRKAVIDVSNELGSISNAQRIGDNFLASHKYPPNAGILNVARPIRDLYTGRMVDPFEIEPAELIRVRGVESYPDALNASSSDGQTVFRIWAMQYTADVNTSTLELDTYPRTTAQALARLQRRRERKR